MNILSFLIIILAFVVFIGIINEKIFHLQSDIALIFFSLIISLILVAVRYIFPMESLISFTDNIGDLGYEE